MEAEQEKIIDVPGDVWMDVLKVLFKNKMTFSVTGINEMQNKTEITISPQGDPEIFQKTVKNIENTLDEYENFLKGFPVK